MWFLDFLHEAALNFRGKSINKSQIRPKFQSPMLGADTVSSFARYRP